ncbi:MAG TPA: DUF433 domain-containing protein [Tepidisphaeraceae bacterium]
MGNSFTEVGTAIFFGMDEPLSVHGYDWTSKTTEVVQVSVGLAYPHIEKPPGGPARLQRVPRIRVAQIAMDYLAHGWSADEIHRQHPYLSLGEIHAGLGYYFDHQTEIDAEIEAELRDLNQGATNAPMSPFQARMRAKGIR